MDNLAGEVADLLSGHGLAMNGFGGSTEEAQAVALQYFPRKPFCIVKQWRIIDVDVNAKFAHALAADGVSAVIVFAWEVILHSAGLRDAGDWVRSTFQRSFSQEFLFESMNTTYILLGDGVRKRGSGEAVLSIGA